MKIASSGRALMAAALICALAIGLAQAARADEADAADDATLLVRTAAGDHAFAIEIADDPAERARGLMHRRDLPRDAGMLFVYDPPQETAFWMKNTPLPLDILFADEAGVIIRIARRTTPFSTRDIPSGGVVRGVLEINGGLSDELGVAEGDRLAHPVFGTPD